MSVFTSPPPNNRIGDTYTILPTETSSQSVGRTVNEVSDIYKLASDEEERSRLDLQHHILKIAIGANFVGPVQAVLAAEDGMDAPKGVLDLGCGSGAWAIDMAKDFPNCRVLGVDLAPNLERPRPPNCSFETADLNNGLELYSGSFDVIAARLIFWGVKNYPGLIHQIGQALRPRGMIHLIEWPFEVYDSQKRPIDSAKNPEASAFGTFLEHARHATRARGGTVDAANNLERWVREDQNFEDVHCEYVWVPIMPGFPSDYPNSEVLNKVGTMFRDNVKSFVGGTRPLLEAEGISAKEIDALANAVIEEGETCRTHVWHRTTCVWARKKDA